ncbi:autotransporter domain-containing protein [Bradyrhizobium sp. WSM2254]|uniref:autotransporter domain-containing protein n=1 Tax=Bradyrhizobium sp. WSM2254 TaxID=1188263 RepID=UPI0012EB4C7D|nr:autotransporter domain-containing protein [Bradyrhizobium sp. WSM2254]
MASALPAAAQDATWNFAPGSGDFNTAANWTPGAVPTGTAFFGTSSMTALSFSSVTTVGGWTFNAGASNYSFGVFGNGQSLSFTGAGIDIQGGSAAITNDSGGRLIFNNTSTAGSASITTSNGGNLIFNNTSTAGSATIFATDSSWSRVFFNNTSTAGSATITANNGAEVHFNATSTAGSASITATNGSSLYFDNTSTAGSATITNDHANVGFLGSSTAGSATITTTNGGGLVFNATSTAGSASIVNNFGDIIFAGSSKAGSASITSNGNLNFYSTSTADAATITSSGNVIFNNSSSAGSASITSTDTVQFNNSSTAGSASIVNTGVTLFYNSSNAGTARITNNSGVVEFNDTSSAGNATITNNASLAFNFSSTAGSAAITNNNQLTFNAGSTAGSAAITNNSQLLFTANSTAGNATITNTNQLTFDSNTTAGNATITNSGNVLFDGNSTAGNAQLINTAPGAVINFFTPGPASDGRISAGSLAGNGRFDLNGAELTVGGNNLSSNVTGVLTGTGIGTGTSLIKIGTGTLTLSGINTYTGATEVNGGTLAVNGSIVSSSLLTVNAGGTLGGNGIVGNTVINGGALAPGNSIGTLSVSGSLTLTAASAYLVQVSGTSADKTVVTGTATLAGTVVVDPLTRLSATTTYTILTSAGTTGAFSSATLATVSTPGFARNARLSYIGGNVLLTLDPGLLSPILPGAATLNQRNVAAGIDNALLAGGSLPAGFNALFALSGGGLLNALSQASGETAAGSQQTTFNAMNQFMGVMTDPFTFGRGFNAQDASSFADESSANSYASTAKSRAARDAYAMFSKAPAAQTYDPRWSVWASDFGGSQTTDGNAAAGSNTSSSRIGGVAAGVDFRFAPDTVAGFAMAGGGTSFSVANGGSGRSDLFQAGGFVRHTIGATYLSGALAYGWQDVNTNRTVIADQLQAHFNANTFSGRFEAGNRTVTSWLGGLGLTPYAAAQVTAIALPAYAETAVAGSNAFALSYAGKTVTDTRSELGLRTDKSFAVNDAILTLRGRAAWAHDFNTDRAASATFIALPGASFVVNGAAAARDAALTTASAEMTFISGISLAATFEGEFSQVTRSYAGKGVVRYAW